MALVARLRVHVARITHSRTNVVHDAYVMPSGRIYYRRDNGQYESGPPINLPPDLKRCIQDVKDDLAHYLRNGDLFGVRHELRRRIESARCSFTTMDMDVFPSAL